LRQVWGKEQLCQLKAVTIKILSGDSNNPFGRAPQKIRIDQNERHQHEVDTQRDSQASPPTLV